MESYPLEFVNLDGTIENGNPNVVNSDNYNFDLKWEMFPKDEELISSTANTINHFENYTGLNEILEPNKVQDNE